MIMKKRNIVVSIFILLLLGLTVLSLFNKIQQSEQKKEVFQSIPEFQIPDINDRIVSDEILKESRIVMFIYFDPDCESCREEIKQIREDKSSLSQGQLIFFSGLSADSIRQFLRTIDFVPPTNMLFLPDEKAILIRKMDVRTTPTIFIYREGQLIKRYEGPVKIETLISYFTEQ